MSGKRLVTISLSLFLSLSILLNLYFFFEQTLFYTAPKIGLNLNSIYAFSYMEPINYEAPDDYHIIFNISVIDTFNEEDMRFFAQELLLIDQALTYTPLEEYEITFMVDSMIIATNGVYTITVLEDSILIVDKDGQRLESSSIYITPSGTITN